MRVLYVLLLTTLSISCYSQEAFTISENGVDTYFRVYGKGTPMLVINGGPGMNSEGFTGLAELFSEKNQAIIYDQRGTGKSTMEIVDSNTVTLDLMVEDIERIRKHLKIKKWVVFGHSFGGMLASYYATKYPKRIKGLILSASGGVDLELFNELDIQGKLTEEQRDSLGYWNQKIAEGDTSYHARLQRGKFLAPAYLYDDSHVPKIAIRLTQGNNTLNGLVFQDMFKMPFDCKPLLKKFKKPVLIIQGKQDIIPVSISELAHGIFPNSRLVILDQCAHYPWLEKKTAYLAAIHTFLKDI